MGTAKGLDATGPLFYEHLPAAGREQWGKFFGECVSRAAWPWQLLSNLMVLAGKPGGGERALALQGMPVRIVHRACRPVPQEWLRKNARRYDDAIAGSSAIRGAMLQLPALEFAESSGKCWALLFWDLQKFFDTVGLAMLMANALAQKFSPTILRLAVLQYLSLRVVRSGNCHSEWVQPIDSILAGCGKR